MFGKCVRSSIEELGKVTIIFIVFSLVFPETIAVRHLYQMVFIVIPVHLFSFFTFELKLFSSRIWIRRAIVIFFSILVLFVCAFVFNGWRSVLDNLLIYGIVVGIAIIIIVFICYAVDKIEQQNLKLINQRLEEKNADNI